MIAKTGLFQTEGANATNGAQNRPTVYDCLNM